MKGTTKDNIAEAFLAVSGKKPLDKVTVKDVADAIGISRQTFYYHFKDMVEVIEYVMERELSLIFDRTLEAKSHEEALEMMFSFRPEKHDLHQKILHSRYREELEHISLQHVRMYMRKMFLLSPIKDSMSQEEIEVALSFYSWAILGVMFDHAGKPCDAKSLAAQISKLISGKIFLKSAQTPAEAHSNEN